MRVKNPRAAIWPAIGIVVEIMLLVLVVFSSGKFKGLLSSSETLNVDADDEDDRNQSQNRSDSDPHFAPSDTTLRYRNVD